VWLLPRLCLNQKESTVTDRPQIENNHPKKFLEHREKIRELANISGFELLLVEDAHDNRFFLAKMLRHFGALVDTAENGTEAVAKASQKNYDVILMDIQMPDIDGYEATQLLRTRGYVHPILALSAHAMREERERALQSGFDDYVTKPIERSELFDSLNRLKKN
jgi:CheY-like chemotaxis protein